MWPASTLTDIRETLSDFGIKVSIYKDHGARTIIVEVAGKDARLAESIVAQIDLPSGWAIDVFPNIEI